jgi:hypothetical protein
MFTLKSNGELRLCINYRKFNNITIKNWYTLSLAKEI